MMPCATVNCKKSVNKFSERTPLARVMQTDRAVLEPRRLSSTIAPRRTRVAEHSKMKRKYGSALARESEAEKAQRLRAKEMRDNSHNYGSVSRKGAISRGKKRGKAYRAGS
jgi:hypothetical protein